MLTKQLRFTNDVLDILRGIEWSQDGLLGILTCGQLDRTLYLKVNKALVAMGGKWNRKEGGHIFKVDPRPTVAGLLDNGTLAVERDGFFETPPEIVGRMLELVLVRGKVLEPSAGLGAIATRLPVGRDMVWCIEKNPDRSNILREKGYRVECMDFLSMSEEYFDTVVMNPPFEQGQDIDHVRHAYDLLAPGGQLVSVMSEGPFFRQDKKATAFREWLEGVGHQKERLPAGAFKNSGTGVNACLIVVHKGYGQQRLSLPKGDPSCSQPTEPTKRESASGTGGPTSRTATGCPPIW